MKFKEAYVILVPEVNSRPFMRVDPAKDRSILDTLKYTCYTILVQNQVQALEECQKLVQEEGVNSITFCPGFTDKDVAQISDIVGENIGICVARGDSNNSNIVSKLIEQDY
ncbi:DUF6506 family protein [Desulfosporosinus sp.]|uniref:DUF6506 family protein n=1 Tax=Desulfosporosinus sp. TaxID=157907 RepID=UPI0025C26BB6|nr:DUF6506 family protein [Desulfosporosinus sp.]MBC2723750.1 hypothetical protein [Desulfosporosinus sp.]MBC2727118.1 hypothetical protein [Desulfosporosinus sp.]